jgi:hypothetical protein
MATSLPVQGTMSTTLRTLYVVPRGKTADISWFSVCNEGPVTATLRLHVRRATQGSVVLGSARLAEQHTARVIEKTERLLLRAGDAIEGIASTTNLTFLISGTES